MLDLLAFWVPFRHYWWATGMDLCPRK